MKENKPGAGDTLEFGKHKGKIISFTGETDEGGGLYRLPFFTVEVEEPWGTDIYEVPLKRSVYESKRTGTPGE